MRHSYYVWELNVSGFEVPLGLAMDGAGELGVDGGVALVSLLRAVAVKDGDCAWEGRLAVTCQPSTWSDLWRHAASSSATIPWRSEAKSSWWSISFSESTFRSLTRRQRKTNRLSRCFDSAFLPAPNKRGIRQRSVQIRRSRTSHRRILPWLSEHCRALIINSHLAEIW